MLFCAFRVPEPSSTSADMAQNSIPANMGHVPVETPAARELQTVSRHKEGNSKEKENILPCSSSVGWARPGPGPSFGFSATLRPAF